MIADIRLADGSSGLDAVNDILRSFTVPVVFVTAFPEQLSPAIGPEPTFLIPKPFREDAVKAIVSQVLFFDQQATKQPVTAAPLLTVRAPAGAAARARTMASVAASGP